MPSCALSSPLPAQGYGAVSMYGWSGAFSSKRFIEFLVKTNDGKIPDVMVELSSPQVGARTGGPGTGSLGAPFDNVPLRGQGWGTAERHGRCRPTPCSAGMWHARFALPTPVHDMCMTWRGEGAPPAGSCCIPRQCSPDPHWQTVLTSCSISLPLLVCGPGPFGRAAARANACRATPRSPTLATGPRWCCPWTCLTGAAALPRATDSVAAPTASLTG